MESKKVKYVNKQNCAFGVNTDLAWDAENMCQFSGKSTARGKCRLVKDGVKE
jgi:hypothetical protein